MIYFTFAVFVNCLAKVTSHFWDRPPNEVFHHSPKWPSVALPPTTMFKPNNTNKNRYQHINCIDLEGNLQLFHVINN